MHADPCFAESWMRATHDGQPTGAVATFMSTISLNWAPPMTAQDEFVNIVMDIPSQYSGTQPGIKKTFAGAALNASHKMLLIHGTGSKTTEDFDAWTIFGDPTLILRSKVPQEMEVDIPALIFGEASTIKIGCNAEGAVVVITQTDENENVVVLHKTVIENGIAEIS